MTEENDRLEVKVDISNLESKINELTESVKAALEVKELERDEPKGEVVTPKEDHRSRIVEALRTGSLKEQWEAPISLPGKSAARIVTFVQRSDAVQGKMGDVVTVPYINDFDMDLLTNVGDTLTAKTGLYGTVQTTLKEAAATTNIPYADIEKLSEQLLSELEARFGEAALRAIDKHILDTLNADADVPEVDHSAATGFVADWIPEALSTMIIQGKSVEPYDCILVISPGMYKNLYQDIAGSTSLSFARPDIIQKGLVAEFMGVKILVSQYLPTYDSASGKLSAYMIHRNAIVFAPKRELLIETERDTAARQVKLTGSYTFGVAVIDNKAVVEIKAPETS